MHCCTDCENAVCDDHIYFGNDGLERCARCDARRERADAGPPPPPPPGEEAGTADHPVKVETDVVVMDQLHFHPQGLDLPAGAKGPLGLLVA